MKIYMVNETYDGAAKILRSVHKKAFSNREKAVEYVRNLIEEDKRSIMRYGYDPQFREKFDERDDRFWLYWKDGSHCWEIHELTVE